MSLQLILGPMYAGKTTELIRRMRRHRAAQETCLLIRYMHDVRYSSDCVSTHDRQMLPSASAECIADVMNECAKHSVIGIDEGQFYPDLVSSVELLLQQGKTVVISALDGDYRRKAFGHVLELVPLADEVTKLLAVCSVCHTPKAAFTRRISGETEQELIGGVEKYLAVCRICYEQPNVIDKRLERVKSSELIDLVDQ